MRTFFKTLAYTLAYLVSLVVRPRGVCVLMYHSVDMAGWRYGVNPDMFERQMRFLSQHRSVISLADVVACAKGEKALPRNSVAITFDDGYKDTYTTAFPILKKYKLPATVFLTSDLSRKEALGNLERPTWEEIRDMQQSGLVSFEVHGVTHARLTDIEHDRAAFTYELSGCRDEIEKNTEHRPRFAAYSFGAKSHTVLERTQTLGFDAAFGTHEGMVKKGSNLFALRRVQVDRTMSFLLFRLRTTGAVEVYRWMKFFK
jgi:peptidoglycan/xylan/chitin deacetylase (PgdA/CDA1 family)